MQKSHVNVAEWAAAVLSAILPGCHIHPGGYGLRWAYFLRSIH